LGTTGTCAQRRRLRRAVRSPTQKDRREWSVGLLDDAERSLLETRLVFVDGWIIDAATEVAGPDEDQTLDLTEALARHSLIYLNVADRGPRSRVLSEARRRGYMQWSASADANVSKRVSNRP
jgi:hypothetical protein